MLASTARLVMRQLFLGMTGNTMIIAQPAASYEQVLPNVSGLSEGIVVCFCCGMNDIFDAQACR